MAKILIVDDAAFMRMRSARLLTEAGHDVVEAENGRDAVERYRQERPNLVLMDITMPEMDGIAATAAIKQSDPGATIVMVSALGQQSMVMAAIKAGARDFVVKPFQPERVMEVVTRLLGPGGACAHAR